MGLIECGGATPLPGVAMHQWSTSDDAARSGEGNTVTLASTVVETSDLARGPINGTLELGETRMIA